MSLSVEQTKKYAFDFASELKPGDWIFLNGDLGAGKTFITKQILAALGTQDNVTSPTFSLLSNVRTTHKEIKKICHLDLYRLKKPEEILYFGLEEEFSPSTDIVVIEWADMLEQEHWAHFFAVTG